MSDSYKILVVEDNDFVRMQIVRYLKDQGNDLVEARQGDEAIDVVSRQDIDLAIVDVRMEPVDGFEFIRTIRGMDMDTPVILVTGDNAPDLLEQSGKWGVGSVLIKPVQKDRLLKTVDRVMADYARKV